MNNRIDIERLRQLCAKNLNAVQIAARLGVTSESVREACKRHGLTVAAAPLGKQGICSVSTASLHTENATTGRSE
jgi:hypothetical protein